jgi:transcriptional regulator with XRE-family HTH domain
MENELISRIGKRIKTLRKERGLTLQVLSERSHITKGLLSKIENSRTIPSLPVFFKLIGGLDMNAKDFFDNMNMLNGQNYLHIKETAHQSLQKEDRPGFDYQFILGQSVPSSMLEIVLLSVSPGSKSVPTTTDGFEFKYILSGRCQYYIDGEQILLEKGDSLYFDASKPHYPVNGFRKKVTMLVIYFLTTK